MDKLFNILSNTGCIVYDVETNNNQGFPDTVIKDRMLIKPINNNQQNYLDTEDGMWYNSNQVSQPKLNLERFEMLKNTFGMINDSKIEISNMEDIKKIYAINFLKKIDELDDFKKIEYISNLI